MGRDFPLTRCGCGQHGCIENYLSGRGFAWLYEHFYHQKLEAPQIITLWEQGDAQAREHVERYLDLLAVCLGNILTIVDPDLLVIGEGCQTLPRLRNGCPGVCPDIYCRLPACRVLNARDTGTQEACAEPHSFISPISLRGFYAVASRGSTQPFSQNKRRLRERLRQRIFSETE